MNQLKLITIVQSVLIAGLVLTAVILLLFRNHEKEETVPVSLEVEETKSYDYTPEADAVYETTGEKIFLRDAEAGEIWIPVLADVPACEYKADQYVTRNGLMYYTENGKVISRFGIDVSAHQREIDWATVKKAGVEFAMIRVGYRGYTEGILAMDDCFERNMQGAQDAGIDIGVYFYSQAVTPEEAIEEAEFVLSAIADKEITYPVVYDWEVVTNDTARTDDVSVRTLTQCSIAFCERIRQAGYMPMIYQNKRTSLLKLDLPELTDYDFWLAEYNDEATYYYNYQMWQYASDGTVPGVEGHVDVNICFKDYTNPESESDENA